MAEMIASGWHLLIGTIVPFLFVITIVVFFHELGHFYVGRKCGVGVDAFSVGFGPELCGYTDKKGTRWKISAIPLGGYVKFHGDANAASVPDNEALAEMNEMERSTTLESKSVGQRAAVVFAGPAANFILSFLIFVAMFMIQGKYISLPVVSQVMENGSAEQAGVKVGDIIRSIDGVEMESFSDVIRIVAPSANRELTMVVERDGKEITIPVTPKLVERKDNFGNTQEIGQIGIASTITPEATKLVKYGPLEASLKSVEEVWFITSRSLYYIYDIFAGRQSAEQLSGPIRIAKVSGEVATLGIWSLINLTALLSVSIGLLNLFPIPMLDGGHLAFYAYEAIRGKPLNEKTQEFGYKIGIFLVLALMLFVTKNDISYLIWPK